MITTLDEALALPDGIYHDMPEDIYHALPYVGSSTLKRFAANPFTCHDPVEGIPAVGSASHVYSLEGIKKFTSIYTVMPIFPCPEGQNPKGWKNTTAYKDQVNFFLSANQGKTMLTGEEFEAVLGIDKSLKAHPVTRRILMRGANELSIIWTDRDTGLRCKARIDDYPGNGIVNDLKTTASVEYFASIYRRLRYSIQAGHYTNGLEVLNEKVQAFIFCVASYNAPYSVRTGRVGMPEDAEQIDRLQAARVDANRLLRLYAQCKEQNVWPNYEIPAHIYDINQIQEHDLLEDWNGLEGRYR